MRVKWGALLSVLAVLLLLGSAFHLLFSREDREHFRSRMDREAHSIEGGVVWISHKVKGDGFKVLMDRGWEDVLVKGVNMGISKPGHLPGECSITYEEYYRWFGLISDLGANTIRVYTVHPPDFYRALYEHNRRAKEPLFLLQGIYYSEDILLSSGDPFDADVNHSFMKAIERTIDVIHGKAEIAPTPGNASGSFRVDVSDHVIGIVIGIEWDPMLVKGTIESYPEITRMKGSFLEVGDGNAFEVWLAHMMDHTARYETEMYSEQRPLSFINWPTTDKYDHPYESFYHEDLVSLDPDVMVPTWNMVPGLFATYHVYPYYPDFMTLEPEYLDYLDAEGKKDNYAGYLHELKTTHSMPVLIGEFGVPSSRGIAHEGLDGRDHGHMTEEEQGQVLSELFRCIVSEGLAGGLIFSWQDEWFKRTWNTMDLTEPDRRACWMDVQTCEQHFGLLAFDPASPGTRTIDGNDADWEEGSTSLFLKDGGPLNPLGDGFDQQRTIEGLRISNDEAYIYIGLGTGATSGSNWDMVNMLVLIDTMKGQGSTEVPFGTGLGNEVGFDFVVQIKGENGSRVMVDSYYDLHGHRNGHQLGLIEEAPYASIKDNGVFHPILFTVNRGFWVPASGQYIPYRAFDAGELRWGGSDRPSETCSSLTDICSSRNGSFIELRLPYLLLNFRDPSTRSVNGDPWTEGFGSSRVIDGIRLAVVTFKPGSDGNATGVAGPLKVTDSLPAPVDGELKWDSLPFHSWSGWEVPRYTERTKGSYLAVKEAFSDN